MTNLKPCPFCGGEAEFNVCKDVLGRTVEAYVVCINCHCDVGCFGNEEYATEAWNTRAEKPDSFEIVRCSECKHYEFRCGSGTCMMGIFYDDYEPPTDFFCAFGKRGTNA